jgi:tRNA (cytidine/uridine-2'-O-)-methyltransferase
MHVVLVHPEIAGNTGNIIRLCANAGAVLHLVEPLGFVINDRDLRRAGLDYHDLAPVTIHSTWDACIAALPSTPRWALTARATATYADADITTDDVLVYGQESTGLPDTVLDTFDDDRRLRIPMRAGNRSLNLANSVALVVYDVWRRNGFDGSS